MLGFIIFVVVPVYSCGLGLVGVSSGISALYIRHRTRVLQHSPRANVSQESSGGEGGTSSLVYHCNKGIYGMAKICLYIEHVKPLSEVAVINMVYCVIKVYLYAGLCVRMLWCQR